MKDHIPLNIFQICEIIKITLNKKNALSLSIA